MSESPPTMDYESPFPECRVTATVDEFALLRLDMDRDQAAYLAKRFQGVINDHEAQHEEPGEELLTLGVTMTEATYKRFANQVQNLVAIADKVSPDEDESISAQVVISHDLTHEDEDGISLSVFLSETQLYSVHQNCKAALSQSDGGLHRWEFAVSYGGAQMLVQQLVAAVQGAEDPLDHVDVEEATDE